MVANLRLPLISELRLSNIDNFAPSIGKMEERLRIGDKEFDPFLTEKEILEGVDRVAEQLNEQLAEARPLFLSVLNGAFLFSADLLKRLHIDCEISFVKVASYHGTTSTGTVKQLVGLNESLEGRTVVILEDIVDTGNTLQSIVRSLREHHPRELRVATLLFKPDAYRGERVIDHRALTVPDEFLVGYGLDYDGLGRNLRDIYKLA
jgi:hypoxanthine phosphoribosyltransferase